MTASSSSNAKPGSPRRRFWFGVFAIFVPSAVGLLVVGGVMLWQERLVIRLHPLVFRFQSPPRYVQEKDFALTGHRYLFDETLGWRNIPYFEATTLGQSLRINSRGLRDSEYPYQKEAGTRRILVLGDSMTWGLGVSNEQIFTEVLERQLSGQSTKWEVINAGVSGWGTDQQYLFLKNEGLKYQPDIVLVAYYLVNDPENNVADVQYGLGKPCFADGNLEEYRPPVFNPGVESRTVEKLSQLDTTIMLLSGLQSLCEENGVRLALMTFGVFGETSEKWSNFYQWLRDETLFELRLRHGADPILFLDLDAEFLARNITPRQIFEGNVDRHWNEFGHRFVGQALHRFLHPDHIGAAAN